MMKKILIMASAMLIITACSKKEKAFDATGTFEATEVTVSAKATGELKSFDITEGDTLQAGTKLGQIDTYQLVLKKQQLETQRGQLAASKRQMSSNRSATNSQQLDLNKQLSSIQQQITNAQHERRRYAELVKDGAVPRKQLDDIDNQIKVLNRQLEATRDQIRSNNAALAEQGKGISAQMEGIDSQVAGIDAQQRQLDDQIANADIVAPIKGTVLEKYTEMGEYVTVGKPLFKMANVEQMYIRAYVSSAQLQNIKLGQQCKVFADYGNGHKKEYAGTVTWISSKSEFTPKTILTDDERADLVYAVKIMIQNDGFVKIGMYGEVKF